MAHAKDSQNQPEGEHYIQSPLMQSTGDLAAQGVDMASVAAFAQIVGAVQVLSDSGSASAATLLRQAATMAYQAARDLDRR